MNPIFALYGEHTGNCIRAAIALEEAAITYEERHIALARGEHRQSAFLKINPTGKVPALVQQGEDGPFVLTQSNAIIFYADSLAPGKLAPEVAGHERALVIERFFYFVTDVIGPSHASFFISARDSGQGRATLVQRAIAALSFAELYASATPYIGGDTFSMADIAAFTIASSFANDIDWGALPNLQNWYQDVAARPSVTRGMQAFAGAKPIP